MLQYGLAISSFYCRFSSCMHVSWLLRTSKVCSEHSQMSSTKLELLRYHQAFLGVPFGYRVHGCCSSNGMARPGLDAIRKLLTVCPPLEALLLCFCCFYC